MRFVTMLRIKNEERWIKEVIESTFPLCERVYVMDDHSTDHTLLICRNLPQPKVKVFESPFPAENLDESRDKNWLYDRILKDYPTVATWPDWILCLDGDEVLAKDAPEIIRRTCENTTAKALSLRILYLWNRPDQIRTDGVYEDFARPSLFRVINPAFRFQTTPWNGNLHCSSIPQELIHGYQACEAAILHYGYMLKEDRIRKWEWYNRIDPDNEAEDCYLHMILGDDPRLPGSLRRKWGGPLRLEPLR